MKLQSLELRCISLQLPKILLAKLGVQGLLLGTEPWKQLFLYELENFCPKISGDWNPNFNGALWKTTSWLSQQNGKTIYSIVLNSWKYASLDLDTKRSPKTEADLGSIPDLEFVFYWPYGTYVVKTYSMCMGRIRSRTSRVYRCMDNIPIYTYRRKNDNA